MGYVLCRVTGTVTIATYNGYVLCRITATVTIATYKGTMYYVESQGLLP